MSSLIPYLLIVILAVMYIYDVVKWQTSIRKYTQLVSDQQKKITNIEQQLFFSEKEKEDYRKQLETTRSANKLLSADLDELHKNLKKQKDFNEILKFDNNNLRKDRKND
jgi:septal ring factor EnvC (AmiA/AmiB activator)